MAKQFKMEATTAKTPSVVCHECQEILPRRSQIVVEYGRANRSKPWDTTKIMCYKCGYDKLQHWMRKVWLPKEDTK